MKRLTLVRVGQYAAITLLSIVFSWLVSQRIKESLSYQSYPIGYDARSYIAAATALRQGYSPYETATWEHVSIDYQFAKYLYPPLLAILLIPVSFLPILPATYICVLLSFLSAIVFFAILRHSLDWKMAVIVVFAFPPT